jgi:hypothetical protein
MIFQGEVSVSHGTIRLVLLCSKLKHSQYKYFQLLQEMSIGIRGFTIGYDFYAPERSVCFHHYAEGKNKAARNKVKHFWENTNA